MLDVVGRDTKPPLALVINEPVCLVISTVIDCRAAHSRAELPRHPPRMFYQSETVKSELTAPRMPDGIGLADSCAVYT